MIAIKDLVVSVVGEGGALFKKGALFLLDNDLFHRPALVMDEKAGPMVSEEDAGSLKERLEVFAAHLEDGCDGKAAFLLEDIKRRFPVTGAHLEGFVAGWNGGMPIGSAYHMMDYLAVYMRKDICLMSDDELLGFSSTMYERATIGSVRQLSDLAFWIRTEAGGAHYASDIVVSPRGQRASTQAFGIGSYASLLYHLVNREHLEEEHLYARACDDPMCADALAYLGTHLICALRDTDLARLPHPELPGAPEVTLARIRDGDFTDAEAEQALDTMLGRLEAEPLLPNKTRRFGGIAWITFVVPSSLREHFGRVYSICECHRLIGEGGGGGPLFRPVKDSKAIRRILGDPVGEALEWRNASPTAFSKTFMQMVSLIGQEGGQEGPEKAFVGYRLAAMARSHKGGYASFASSTADYLSDGRLSGLTPEMAIGEMFERGILSCHTSMFLSLLAGEDYTRLSFAGQTMAIKELGLTGLEIEQAAAVFQRARAQAVEAFKEILSQPSPEEKAEAVSRAVRGLISGMAPARESGALCFVIALDRPCLHPEARSCLQCPYRVDTRETLYHAVKELKRLKALKKAAAAPGEKEKHSLIASHYVIPVLNHAIQAAGEMYGKDAADAVARIIQEAMARMGCGSRKEGKGHEH